jgi:hypothetical protein
LAHLGLDLSHVDFVAEIEYIKIRQRHITKPSGGGMIV